MSANRIKGITVEIGGDTAKLQTALKGVNGEIRNTQAEDIRHKTASYTHSHNADCYGISFNHINKHGTQFGYTLQYRIIANKCRTQEIRSSEYRKYQLRWKKKLMLKTGYIEEDI